MPKETKRSSNRNRNSPESREVLLASIRDSVAKTAQLTEKMKGLQARHSELLQVEKELKQEIKQRRAESRRNSH